jgi:hypothetical protein
MPVRNSDFWLHLATGRLIARGEYEVGKDPFTFTTEGVRWVNHSWFYDLAVYLIYGVGEWAGVVLIVLKGLAVAALAGTLLILSRRPGQRWLIPGACTAVAVLATGPRLLFQPVVLSYLFLGLTLLVVRWPHVLPPPANPKARRSYRMFWLLPALFALWVNCDQWFFLGPVAAGLYWLGEYLQDALTAPDRKHPRDPAELRTLGYATLAGVAACLVNPHHVFAFTLPAQLGVGDAAAAVKNDQQLKLLFLSPLDGDYWTAANGLSAPGFAYFGLLAAGVASFVLTYNTLRWWRVLVFVPFALLSVYHARAIPFFAVVAGPVTALNFLDYLSETFAGEVEPDRQREYWTLGRAVALAAGVALVVCTVPGWTQTRPYETRHVGWQIVPDASLVRACQQIDRWHREGLVAEDARWFNVSPDVVNYMAWHCPGQRGFLDLRLALFDAHAKQYVDARADLLGKNIEQPTQPGQRQKLTSNVWQEVFADQKIDYAFIYSPDPYALRAPLYIQMEEPGPAWTLCHLNGHTLVSGWNWDADARRRNERLKFDLEPRAFGPEADQAPGDRPDRGPVRFEWYTGLWQSSPPRQPEVDDAVVYHIYSGHLRQRWQDREAKRLQRMGGRTAAALAGAGGATLAVLGDRRSTLFDKNLEPEPMPTPAPLYVAVRGLRKSLRANPDDAEAYLALGRLYFDLFWTVGADPRLDQRDPRSQSFEVRAAGGGFPHVAVLRQAQAAWALNKALQLNPDLEEAHHLLAEWCRRGRERGVPALVDAGLREGGAVYLDVELRHRKEQLRIARENAGRKTSEARADNEEAQEQITRYQEERVKALEQLVDDLSGKVANQQNQLEVQASSRSVVERAQLALQFGLADEALSVLEKATPEDLLVRQGNVSYPVGAILQVKILLSLGRAEQVREVLDSTRKWGVLSESGATAYDWFRLVVAAASGDYDEADDVLAAMHEPSLRAADKIDGVQVAAQVRCSVGGMNALGRLNEYAFGYLTSETDFRALRGWLALERGETEKARQQYRAVRDLAVRRDRLLAPAAAVGVTFPAERVTFSAPVLRPDGATLRSWQLAEWGLYLLDNPAAKGR